MFILKCFTSVFHDLIFLCFFHFIMCAVGFKPELQEG